MSNAKFSDLCEQLRRALHRSDTQFRKAISVEHRVAITIWRLSTNVEYRTIGHLFAVSKTSMCRIVHDVCTAIVKTLLRHYIKFPRGDQLSLRDTVTGFRERWGFPQCAGSVDGTHIPIIAPTEYHADYHYRKWWYSMIMKATVDHQCRFTDIYIGWPGKVHDARVFAKSGLVRRAKGSTLLPNADVDIESARVPLILLGDPA